MTNRALHLNQVVLSTAFENDRLTLTRDHSLRELVSLLMDNLNRLTKRLNHKSDLYQGIPLSPNNPRLQLTSASSKGELFLETLKFTRYIQSMKISQIQRLHPTLVLLVSIFNKYRLSDILIEGDKYWMVDTPEHLQWLNEAFREFQSTLKSPDYKKQVRHFEQGAQKNYRRAQQYIDSLYQRYSKLLVVRVDLSYKSGICHRVKAHHLRQHRQTLYKAINRNRLFSCCVGYILKLEFGIEKGFHYHALFFFDGQKVRRDITLGKLIGELWQERITDMAGLYFNCNYQKERYRELGIGLLKRADAESKKGLLNAVRYLCKADAWVRLAVPELKRTFWRGEIKPRKRQ
ncbi:inovirus-type Gp2 protein [Providencia rettgeri]|uniref:YagK/YfjJ domain-containing protein n=1 Tax=Providencia TaxID=586 RepID=UPI00234A772D|nr:inovirus-type Gp2 protein [Providencia sp. PROV035]MCK9997616.1 inovirus Gp2 family protein [Providencia rettgeri]MCL0017533.1 inovirus Gp2 family protein [Providencia rettgeri]HEE8949064.1 inovirus-type Gp2 protein [Providencia rettgeri]HEM7525554.1 inovirus-type Gp2 protein [Providencia rettgeri]